jgi:hypothetical protein
MRSVRQSTKKVPTASGPPTSAAATFSINLLERIIVNNNNKIMSSDPFYVRY